VYLTTLEATKAWSLETAAMARWAPNEAARAGLANSFAGAFASMVTQSVIVPIDVVSQRLMVAGAQALSQSDICPVHPSASSQVPELYTHAPAAPGLQSALGVEVAAAVNSHHQQALVDCAHNRVNHPAGHSHFLQGLHPHRSSRRTRPAALGARGKAVRLSRLQLMRQ
jgi:hypothetical protein